jgi:hypothetical protein
MWKMKGEIIIKTLPCRRLSDILVKIDIDDDDTIEELNDEGKVADLGFSDGETLLLQLPGTSRISTTVGRVLIQFQLSVQMIVQLKSSSRWMWT